MQQMMLTVRPTSDFEVPSSTGYQLYSALLAVMRSSNPEASGRVHDSEIGTIAVSGLSGTFGRAAKRPGNKMLLTGTPVLVASHQKTRAGLKLHPPPAPPSIMYHHDRSMHDDGANQ